MVSKNDLSALKVKSKNTLININKNINAEVKSVAGRKPKPIMEKQSELIGLRFTPQEYIHIKEKAGLIPIATYLKDSIYKQTDIFK